MGKAAETGRGPEFSGGSTWVDAEYEEREREVVERMLEARIARAERIYDHAITSLWLGNSGAAVATLSLLGVTLKDGKPLRQLMFPLTAFIVGIVLMGLGSILALWREYRAVRSTQEARSILEVRADAIESPAEKILSFRNGRTVMALLAGAAFVVGCVSGLSLLWGASR